MCSGSLASLRVLFELSITSDILPIYSFNLKIQKLDTWFFSSLLHICTHSYLGTHAQYINAHAEGERERDPSHLDWTVFFFVQKLLFFSSKPSLPRPVYLSHFVYLPNSCSCFFINNLSLTHRHTHTNACIQPTRYAFLNRLMHASVITKNFKTIQEAQILVV